MTSAPKMLRLALLTSSGLAEQWKLNAIKLAVENKQAEVIGIIKNNSYHEKKSLFIQRYLKTQVSNFVAVAELFNDALQVDDTDENALTNLNADIIFCCDNDYTIDLKNYTRLGVWRFSFVTNFTLADELTAAVSQSKNCTLALVTNHQIIHKGNFRILKHSWSKTLTQIYTEAEGWLSYCFHLPSNNSASGEKVIQSNSSISFLQQVVFLLILFWNYCRQRVQLVFTKEVWNVGIIAKPINESLQPGFTKDIFWLPHPTHGIFADPFGYETTNSVKIVFENLDFKSNHGKLSMLEFDKQSAFTNGKTFINKKEHLSYPYLFEDNKKLFMLPECCELNKLCLYELNKKTLAVEKEFVLMENIQVVDPSVIFHNNKWWLFCTLKNDKPDLKLHIYFSDTLTGNWQPHVLNPVKIDIASSRPGGTMFIDSNKLYRPSQDSSYSYGDRIIVNEVTELTETSFSEKEVAVVSPHALRDYKKGLHTLSAAGNFTLIDAKKISVQVNYRFFKKLLGRK